MSRAIKKGAQPPTSLGGAAPSSVLGESQLAYPYLEEHTEYRRVRPVDRGLQRVHWQRQGFRGTLVGRGGEGWTTEQSKRGGEALSNGACRRCGMWGRPASRCMMKGEIAPFGGGA